MRTFHSFVSFIIPFIHYYICQHFLPLRQFTFINNNILIIDSETSLFITCSNDLSLVFLVESTIETTSTLYSLLYTYLGCSFFILSVTHILLRSLVSCHAYILFYLSVHCLMNIVYHIKIKIVLILYI